SGNAHYLATDEDDALDYVRTLVGYLPTNNLSAAPEIRTTADLEVTEDDQVLDTLIPDSANQPYDMTTAIEAILDDGELLQVQQMYAQNIVTGFGRVEGAPVGIVANQPTHL